MSRSRVVVVANPTSGRGRGAKLIPKVRSQLSSLGVDHEILISEGPDQPERLARTAAEDGAGIVAALGGDGTVGMVANGLIGTGAALAVIPAGTGDDFAKGVGPRKPLEAAGALRDPRIRPIDVARVTAGGVSRHFVCVAGAGFDSAVNETANAMQGSRLGGTGTYIAAILKTLKAFRPARFGIVVDGEPLELDAMLVAVGNSRSYGGGMRVTPQASLTDGALEVCIVGAMTTGAFLRAFPRVFRGTHVTHPKVTMLRGARIELEADRLTRMYADGELVGPLPVVIEVLPKALPVVVAEGSVADR